MVYLKKSNFGLINSFHLYFYLFGVRSVEYVRNKLLQDEADISKGEWDVETFVHELIVFTPPPSQVLACTICTQDKMTYVFYVNPVKPKSPNYAICEPMSELIEMAQDRNTNEFALGFAVRAYECLQHFTLRLFHFNNLQREYLLLFGL